MPERKKGAGKKAKVKKAPRRSPRGGGRKGRKAKRSDARMGMVTHWRRRAARRSVEKSEGPEKEKGRFRRPDDTSISEAIREILRTHRVVHSQDDLKRLVTEKMAAVDPLFKVSGSRIRKVAFEMSDIKIEVALRIVEHGGKYTKCPVCGTALKANKNQTVYGGTVTTGFKCLKCGYHTGLKRRMPTRYTFSMKGGAGTASCRTGGGAEFDLFDVDGEGEGKGGSGGTDEATRLLEEIEDMDDGDAPGGRG